MKRSPVRLLLDTATPYLNVALYEGTERLGSLYRKGNNDHSVTLMPAVEQLFKDHDRNVEDLDGIVVGIGPGSYTGVRIGVAVAKTLAWSKNIPLYTVSSLALMASGHHGKALPWVDARRGYAFLGLYEVNDHVVQLDEDRYAHLDSYREEIEGEWTAVTSGRPDLLLLERGGLLFPVEDVHHVSPMYLRQTEAERNHSAK